MLIEEKETLLFLAMADIYSALFWGYLSASFCKHPKMSSSLQLHITDMSRQWTDLKISLTTKFYFSMKS